MQQPGMDESEPWMTKEEPNKSALPVPTRSIISRPWLVRIVVILCVLIGYGLWSVWDAYVAYPARGEKYAEFAEWAYLEAAIEADRVESPGVLRREAAIEDPAVELARLRNPETAERNAQDAQGGGRQRRAEMEIARERWLTALSRISRLHPAYTNFYVDPDPTSVDRAEELRRIGEANLDAAQRSELDGLSSRLTRQGPRERYAALNARWTTESPPGPLQSYDIPVNKLSAVICFGFSIYLVYLFVKVATKTYKWDPDERRLTLPDGVSIAPADLEDVDKRKWDKFIVFLKIKDHEHPLRGAEVRFDTYRHGHIEDWILEMERTAFPDRAESAEPAGTHGAGEGVPTSEETDDRPAGAPAQDPSA